jgi:hypothetical protein
MRMKRKSLPTIFTILWFCYALTSCKTTPQLLVTPMENANNGLVLALVMNKDYYQSGESMLATIRIYNVSEDGKGIIVCQWFYDWMELDFPIRDITGERVDMTYMVNVSLPGLYDFIELAPGEVIEYTKDIRDASRPFKPGKYSVQAIYQNRFDPDPDNYSEKIEVQPAWKGKLESNVVTITIKP